MDKTKILQEIFSILVPIAKEGNNQTDYSVLSPVIKKYSEDTINYILYTSDWIRKRDKKVFWFNEKEGKQLYQLAEPAESLIQKIKSEKRIEIILNEGFKENSELTYRQKRILDLLKENDFEWEIQYDNNVPKLIAKKSDNFLKNSILQVLEKRAKAGYDFISPDYICKMLKNNNIEYIQSVLSELGLTLKKDGCYSFYSENSFCKSLFMLIEPTNSLLELVFKTIHKQSEDEKSKVPYIKLREYGLTDRENRRAILISEEIFQRGFAVNWDSDENGQFLAVCIRNFVF